MKENKSSIARRVKQSCNNAFLEIPDATIDNLIDSGNTVQVAKNNCVFSSHKDSSHIYFVVSGLIRVFYQDDDGGEINSKFLAEGDLVYGASFENDADFYAQALEDSVVLKMMSMEDIYQLAQKENSYACLLNKYFFYQLIEANKRELNLKKLTAIQRYQHLYDSCSEDLLARIPQYHLASYLGMNHITFSRVKKKYMTDMLEVS